MFNSAILDVALGVAMVFLLVSTLCSAIREGLEAWLKTRATYLEYAVRELLYDRKGDGLAERFFKHPLINGLYQGDYQVKRPETKPRVWNRGGNLPSYIPARSFALALMDLAARGPRTDAANSDPDLPAATFESLRANVRLLDNMQVQRALLAAIDSAQGDLERVRENLEAWYDGAMDRVSGWYKRSTQWVIFFVSLSVVGIFNVNTIAIAEQLYRDSTLRGAVVAAAENTQKTLTYEEASKSLNGLRLPIGWSEGWGLPAGVGQEFGLWNHVLGPVLGLLITAFAATLGAPFWFDVLNKIMVIRSTVKPHEKSPEEASEDRQFASRRRTPARARRSMSSVPPALPATVAAALGSNADPENDVDGCDEPNDSSTPDDQLPPARGGTVTT